MTEDKPPLWSRACRGKQRPEDPPEVTGPVSRRLAKQQASRLARSAFPERSCAPSCPHVLQPFRGAPPLGLPQVTSGTWEVLVGFVHEEGCSRSVRAFGDVETGGGAPRAKPETCRGRGSAGCRGTARRPAGSGCRAFRPCSSLTSGSHVTSPATLSGSPMR